MKSSGSLALLSKFIDDASLEGDLRVEKLFNLPYLKGALLEAERVEKLLRFEICGKLKLVSAFLPFPLYFFFNSFCKL